MRKYQIEIKSDVIQEAFKKALSFDNKFRGDFFHDLRRSFKEEIEGLLNEQAVQVKKESFLGSTNLRSGKHIEIDPIKSKYNEKLGIEFCSGYGHDDYSLRAINYIDGDYCELPSLFSFSKIEGLSIGNIAILVENGNYDIEIKTPECIKIVGYSYDISSRKKKSYLCLYGIRFEYQLLQPIFDKYLNNCNCIDSDLDEIHFGNARYPIIFICRKCAGLFTCKCFENWFDIEDDIIRLLPHGGHQNAELRKYAEDIKIREKMCHLCTGSIPKLFYGSDMYYSSFLQKYYPCYELLRKKEYQENQVFRCKVEELGNSVEINEKEVVHLIESYIENGQAQYLVNEHILPPGKNIANPVLAKMLHYDYVHMLKNILIREMEKGECRVGPDERMVIERYYNAYKEYHEYIKSQDRLIENKLREKFGYPKIGEGWISETTLFKIVQTLLSSKVVVHHYRGRELEGLEIDIWVPDLKLGIEYQGEQHYQVIEMWGGKEGLNRRIETDRKKKALCKKLGYTLVAFKYDEDLTVENIENKLIKFLR